MNDAAAALLESATFCKTKAPNDGSANTGDEKRPGLVGLPDFSSHQICPDDLTKGVDELTDAAPQTWYVRVMFDELLNPDIEELIPVNDDTGMPTGTYTGSIANTHPFTLQCQGMAGGMVDVPYDGYYSPSGNNVTWPLGPSLVIKPADPTLIHTTSECQVTILDNVVDKDGNKVPADQRGPYKFKIAPISVIAVSPADGDAVDPIDAGVDVTFNTVTDDATFDTTAFKFTPDVPNAYVSPEGNGEYFIGADFPVNGSYTWEMLAGAKIKDQCGFENTLSAGDVASMTKVSFTTNDIMLRGIAPFDTQMNAAPAKKIEIKFNQYMDPTTFTAADFTLTPAVPNMAIDFSGGLNLMVYGDFSPNTDYTFTLKAGAMIDDCPGAELAFGGTCAKSATFANASDQVIHFHTAAIALTGTSPKDNAAVTKATTASGTKVTLSFNQDMDATTLTADEFTISPSIPLAVAAQTVPNAITVSTGTTMVAAGAYTFTLKAGATINDTLGNTYTNPADLVIHFTVKDPAPPQPASVCL